MAGLSGWEPEDVMRKIALDPLSVLAGGVVVLGAFWFGRAGAPGAAGRLTALPARRAPVLPVQGRRVGGKSRTGSPGRGTGKKPADGLFVEMEGARSGAAGDLIAVTGSYGLGTSVLYVIDAKARQLAVYEARGGSRQGRRLVLVGARRIDLDLRLTGYNDESEYSYAELERRFRARGLLPAGRETPVTPGPRGGGGGDESGGKGR